MGQMSLRGWLTHRGSATRELGRQDEGFGEGTGSLEKGRLDMGEEERKEEEEENLEQGRRSSTTGRKGK